MTGHSHAPRPTLQAYPPLFSRSTDERFFVSVYYCSSCYTFLHKLDSCTIYSFNHISKELSEGSSGIVNKINLRRHSSVLALFSHRIASLGFLSYGTGSSVGSFFPVHPPTHSSSSCTWAPVNCETACHLRCRVTSVQILTGRVVIKLLIDRDPSRAL